MPVRKVIIDKANRLYQMPPEVTAFALTGSRRIFSPQADVIDLASFTWPVVYSEDQLPDEKGLRAASDQKISHLKEELAGWLSQRHGIRIVGSKEVFIGGSITSLIHQLGLAFIDAGDVAFVPGVGIPLYRASVVAGNGEPISYTISPKTDWAPRFERLSSGLGRVARLLFLNSPHNPTGAELSEKEMAELIWLAGRENILLINDAAYNGVSHRPPASLLDVPGNKRVGVEVSSFSLQFGLPLLPFGYVAGSREVVTGLKRVARFLPAHLPGFYIDLALEAIRKHPSDNLRKVRERISLAAATASQLLVKLKLENSGRTSVPYLWTRISKRSPSTTLAKTLLRRYRVLVSPGLGFGENGEGYLRFSLLAGSDAFSEATKRVKKSRPPVTRAQP